MAKNRRCRKYAPIGNCAICKREEKLQRDHCHKTLRWRGFLCGKCNRMIGFAYDSVEILVSAVKYLSDETMWVSPPQYVSPNEIGLDGQLKRPFKNFQKQMADLENIARTVRKKQKDFGWDIKRTFSEWNKLTGKSQDRYYKTLKRCN